MKRLRRVLGYLLLVLALAIYFSPKRQLWYAAETALKPYGVVLSGEFVSDSGFSLELEKGMLYYDDLEIAKLGDVSITSFLLFSAVSVAPFSFSDEMQQFLPGTVEEIKVYHSIIDPLHVNIRAEGEFGKLEGAVSLTDHDVNLSLMPSAALLTQKPLWLNELKKQTSGAYTYELAY